MIQTVDYGTDRCMMMYPTLISTVIHFQDILDPVVVGLTVIAAGLTIAKFRPKTSYVAGYNVIVLAIAATVFLALAFATCEKPDIVGLRRDT